MLQKIRLTLALALASTLVLGGCSRTTERETIWAEIGTPSKITEKREMKISDKDGDPKTKTFETILDDKDAAILIKNAKGEEKTSKSVLRGLMTIDEATLTYYQELDKAYGAQFEKDRVKSGP